MSDMYTQEGGSKKKFLAPVIVMLLCMTSLTVAGYAYSATVTNTGDDVVVHGVTLALRDAGNTEDVDTAMYDIEDVNIATHTVNGKAIKYAADPANASGFLTDAAKTGSREGKVVDAPTDYTTDLASFKAGYYVEALKGDVAAGYHPVPVVGDLDTAAEITAAVADHTIFKIGSDYLLKVNNQSGGQVKIQADLDIGLMLDNGAISEVFLVLKDGEGVVVGVIAASQDGFADITGAIADAAALSYTVEAYIALTDYYSSSVPDEFGSNSFAVLFQTVAVA